jgi:hypothetical protein
MLRRRPCRAGRRESHRALWARTSCADHPRNGASTDTAPRRRSRRATFAPGAVPVALADGVDGVRESHKTAGAVCGTLDEAAVHRAGILLVAPYVCTYLV